MLPRRRPQPQICPPERFPKPFPRETLEAWKRL